MFGYVLWIVVGLVVYGFRQDIIVFAIVPITLGQYLVNDPSGVWSGKYDHPYPARAVLGRFCWMVVSLQAVMCVFGPPKSWDSDAAIPALHLILLTWNLALFHLCWDRPRPGRYGIWSLLLSANCAVLVYYGHLDAPGLWTLVPVVTLVLHVWVARQKLADEAPWPLAA